MVAERVKAAEPPKSWPRKNFTLEKGVKMREDDHEIPAGSKVTGVKSLAWDGDVHKAGYLNKEYHPEDPDRTGPQYRGGSRLDIIYSRLSDGACDE